MSDGDRGAGNGVYVFRQLVMPGGYRWERGAYVSSSGPPGDSLFLTDGLKVLRVAFSRQEVDAPREIYPLRDHPVLYRTFADLNPGDRDGAVQFANQYGLLGRGVGVRLLDISKGEETPLLDVVGEPLEVWQYEITRMKWAVHLYEMSERRDVDGLARHLRFCPAKPPGLDSLWLFDTHPGASARVRPADRIVEKVLTKWLVTAEDITSPALHIVREWANQRLEQLVSPQLALNRGTRRHVLSVTPKNLLGAMWLQFATSVAGNRLPLRCKECPNWFPDESGDDRRKEKRLFCSPGCKTKDYRRRRDRALELKGQKKNLTQIVAILTDEGLTTDTETLKRWLTKRGE